MIKADNRIDEEFVSQAVSDMISYGRRFYEKNWNLATSSNYSAVVNDNPLRLLMTASGKHKGELSNSDFVVIDEALKTVDLESKLKPSAEAALHVVLARKAGAKAILHTHSVWSTIISRRYFEQGYIEFCDYEMLKALHGVQSHEERVRIIVLDNSQNIDALAEEVARRLEKGQIRHAFLLKGHGLYTWGDSLAQARNHIEALEFLFEMVGRNGEEQ